MGDACEEWMLCDLAAQSLGAIVYGIYPTASAAEVDYQMRDGGASVFIAEDQEYVDRILPIADQLPDLRTIVVLDASAMFSYRHDKLRHFAELLDSVGDEADISWLERQIAGLSPDTRPLSCTRQGPQVIQRARSSPTANILPRPIP